MVDDGDYQPRAYVRLDELTNWLPMASLSDPNTGGGVQVLMTSSTPVEQVLIVPDAGHRRARSTCPP